MQSNISNKNSKSIKIIQNPKLLFGSQLKKYREVTGLTQAEYAIFHKTKQTYITELERGNKNVQVVTMQKHASSFGVNFFQLGDPDHPVPTLNQMPDPIRRAAEKAVKKREKELADKVTKREGGEKIYKTGTAAELHALISDGFFETPRASREAYLKLHPDADGSNLTDDQRNAIGKVTDTLSKGRFRKLLEKLPPEKGSNAVRFKIRQTGRRPDLEDETDGQGEANWVKS